ncbi:hypothetical protein P691DRAFT_658466 [Macrolepiota fuliginosa MF-IS2]|uniref:DUF6593 domain-containing protein n=1 Tax=Macrolepiota fuliginosa MF-IS2 TaxID=1400762 RepID=A0A9P5XMB5_9AGAR|nr:hypothetical protein P691DRAFT_658466 [Macrolepiota fuliginosa MF-IS2]
MYTNNPYAQGGWYNPANPQTINTERSANTHAAQPSILGALPYPFPSTGGPQHLTFHFTYSTTSILNCSVYGPASKKYIEVSTDMNQRPHVTVFRKYDGSVLATIEWQQRPLVEISGVLGRQYVAQWLPLSPNQSCRVMDARGIKYVWTPVGDAIHLHPYNMPPTQQIIKVHRQAGTVTLDMTTEAVQAGLLETALVATVALQSGRNID